jgi:GH24 family phage-related lysozyme (muramidase)
MPGCYTPKQCEDMLEKKLVHYANSAVTGVSVPVSAKMFSTFMDLNYNIGEAAFCKWTVAAKINARERIRPAAMPMRA